MKCKNKVTVGEFAKRYGLTKDLVYVKRKTCPFIIKEDDVVYVCEDNILLRYKFRRFVYDDTIRLIHKLNEKYTVRQLADLLSLQYGGSKYTWQFFLYHRLYRCGISSYSVFAYRIPKTLWKTWRYLRWLEKRERKR